MIKILVNIAIFCAALISVIAIITGFLTALYDLTVLGFIGIIVSVILYTEKV